MGALSFGVITLIAIICAPAGVAIWRLFASKVLWRRETETARPKPSPWAELGLAFATCWLLALSASPFWAGKNFEGFSRLDLFLRATAGSVSCLLLWCAEPSARVVKEVLSDARERPTFKRGFSAVMDRVVLTRATLVTFVLFYLGWVFVIVAFHVF